MTEPADASIEAYLARTPRSRALFERAVQALPGGSTRTTVYTEPYPPFVDHGSGAVMTDVDGNEYGTSSATTPR
jgi:glutamate-1-semialdehyde 2,1-aminomutase